MSHLPVEILEEIFLLVIPADLSHARNAAVLHLCWVSSLWRRTAMEMSSIWTSLTIQLPPVPNSKARSKNKMFWRIVKEWIERARDLPLSFALIESPHCGAPAPCPACVQLCTHVMGRYSNEVEYLEGLTPHLFESLSYHTFERLHALICDLSRYNIQYEFLAAIASFAPNLRRIALDSSSSHVLSFPNIQASVQIWKQITHISTRIFNYTMLSDVLKACPRLQGAVFHCDTDPWLSFGSSAPLVQSASSPIILPYLTNLTIVLYRGRPLHPGLFRDMDMPALGTFRLGSFRESDFGFDYRSLEGLSRVHRGMRHLRRLSIFFLYLSEHSGLVELLSQLSDLQELDIQDCINFDGFFTQLNVMQERSMIPLLPRLCLLSLDFRGVPHESIDSEDLAFFLRSRFGLDDPESSKPNSFQALIFLSGSAAQIYRSLASPANRTWLKGVPVQFFFWDADIGCRGTRWKYRLQPEEGTWPEGVRWF
ncbi:hypothetical protein GALMADRAFT_142419 [Galerina marginata CBS 339.88]|uniref:F-box domain-containing protein n=1 Tax=Galerina marginata (strain CBS 339.88) TaxID=685588 RepID=A0A067SQS6_GALM3|nr:hypothetical protein GALMADRAFT_142419 [Galerina marginata CBS 339.88]